MADDKLTIAEVLSDNDIIENILTWYNEESKEEDKMEQEILRPISKEALHIMTLVLSQFRCHDTDTSLQQQVINTESTTEDDYYKTRSK